MTRGEHTPGVVDLLPCPFCGGEAKRITLTKEDGHGNEGGDVIGCTLCGASSHVEFGRKENLVSRWNQRPEAADLISELVGALEVYADRKSWHWNGAAWEWNGAGSGQYRGDPTARAHQYPAQECVDAECGSVARVLATKARGGAA